MIFLGRLVPSTVPILSAFKASALSWSVPEFGTDRGINMQITMVATMDEGLPHKTIDHRSISPPPFQLDDTIAFLASRSDARVEHHRRRIPSRRRSEVRLAVQQGTGRGALRADAHGECAAGPGPGGHGHGGG